MQLIRRRTARNGFEVEEKRNCLFNLLSAAEKVAALLKICEKLVKIEADIRQMIPVAEVKMQNSAMVETMVPVLEAAARILLDDQNI